MLKRSWLLQRLSKPVKNMNMIRLSFGGGGSGFTSEAEEVLSQICDFEYMGASEYEFGAPSKCLQRMLDNSENLSVYVFNIPYKAIMPYEVVNGHRRVFIICNKTEVEEIKARIEKWASDYRHQDTRDMPYIDVAMAGGESYGKKYCGWIDIDNDFMFFTDQKMWRKFAAIFKLKIPSKREVSKIK
jgi:hypothetical protein